MNELRSRAAFQTNAGSEADQTGPNRGIRSGDFHRALHLHTRAAATGLSSDSHILTTLIKLYSRFGKMHQAQQAFNKLLHQDAASWTCLIMGYVENGQSSFALELFERLIKDEQRAFPLDSRVYVSGLSACLALYRASERTKWVKKARAIHLQAERNQCLDVYVQSALIDLYSRCGNMTFARRVFDRMNQKNVVSWTVIMQGYVENGYFEIALKLFDQMDSSPDPRAFVVAITACGALGARDHGASSSRSRWLEKGRRVHAQAASKGFCSNLYVQSSLVDMYGKCGSMSDARIVFISISKPNVVSWTSLLQGYVENGESKLALELFGCMPRACPPNDRTYIAALAACAALAAEERSAMGRCTARWLHVG